MEFNQNRILPILALIVGITFLAYSTITLFAIYEIDEEIFRFIIGMEFIIGSVFLSIREVEVRR